MTKSQGWEFGPQYLAGHAVADAAGTAAPPLPESKPKPEPIRKPGTDPEDRSALQEPS